MVIAATAKIKRYGDRLQVPSQSGHGFYMVDLSDSQCSCPDWETRRANCKHIFAALYYVRREVWGDDGSKTVTETIAVATGTRPTYPQDWTAYNQAQTCEQDKFQSLFA